MMLHCPDTIALHSCSLFFYMTPENRKFSQFVYICIAHLDVSEKKNLTNMSRTKTIESGAAAETTEHAGSLVLMTPATDTLPLHAGPLSSFLKEGTAFVDNSGSTSGSILRNCSVVIQNIAPRYTALWNSRCGELTSTCKVKWTSTGGTSPSTIYAKYPALPTVAGFQTMKSFILLTDGQVSSSEVEHMASHVERTSHLPTVLGIAAVEVEGHHTVDKYNVSVLFAHFIAARSGILVIIDGPLSRSNKVKVIAAKGEMANHPQLEDLPDLGSNPTLDQFPDLSIDALKLLKSAVYAPQPPNSVLVDGGRQWLHLDALSKGPAGQFVQVVEVASEAEMEDIVRTYHAQGALAQLRHMLQQLNTSINAQVEEDVSTARDDSGTGVAGILARLRFAESEVEKDDLRAQLLPGMLVQSATEVDSREDAKISVRAIRAKIGIALAAVSVIERVGMGADVLGRLRYVC